MRWKGRRGSRNIEDRRGMRGAGGLQIGGVGLLAVLAIGYVLGIDVTPLLQQGGAPVTGVSQEITQADREAGAFVSVTLADTEEVWSDLFRTQLDRAYDPATLVLFKGITQSPCGGASGATGPFYCPADQKAYLDTAFFTTLSARNWARRAISPPPMSWRMKSRIMSRTNWASWARPTRPGRGCPRSTATRSRCGSSCRPIACLGSGRTMHGPGSTAWSAAILPRR